MQITKNQEQKKKALKHNFAPEITKSPTKTHCAFYRKLFRRILKGNFQKNGLKSIKILFYSLRAQYKATHDTYNPSTWEAEVGQTRLRGEPSIICSVCLA